MNPCKAGVGGDGPRKPGSRGPWPRGWKRQKSTPRGRHRWFGRGCGDNVGGVIWGDLVASRAFVERPRRNKGGSTSLSGRPGKGRGAITARERRTDALRGVRRTVVVAKPGQRPVTRCLVIERPAVPKGCGVRRRVRPRPCRGAEPGLRTRRVQRGPLSGTRRWLACASDDGRGKRSTGAERWGVSSSR